MFFFVFCLFVISSFRVFVISSSCFRYFVFSHGVICLFAWHLFVFSPGVISPPKDEITPSEKTRLNNARRKDEKTPREKTTKSKFQMASFCMAFFRLFALKFCLSAWRVSVSSFRLLAWRYFVFLSFCMTFFSSFRLFAWRFLPFRVASFRREKTNWHNPATICFRWHFYSSLGRTGTNYLEIHA